MFPIGYNSIGGQMSRTIRCKNARECDPKRYLKSIKFNLDGGRCWVWYYPDDKREQFINWYFAHGESRHANHRTPGKYYRKHREAELRSHSAQELARYKKNPCEYEPMIRANPKSHYWDWS
jgi:hypothetical protein